MAIRRAWRSRRVQGAVAGLVLLAATAVVVTVGGDDDSAPAATEATTTSPAEAEPTAPPAPTTPAATPAPEPNGEATTPAPAEATLDPVTAQVDAQAVLTSYILAADAAYQNPEDELTALADIATGSAFDEVEAGVSEFVTMAWTQTGNTALAAIVDTTVDVASMPATVAFDVCLDTSAVDVVDPNGESVRTPASQGATRTLHHYVISHADGVWTVSGHSLPAAADC